MESRFFQGVTAGRGCCGLKSGGKPGRDTPGACGGEGRWQAWKGHSRCLRWPREVGKPGRDTPGVYHGEGRWAGIG